MIARHSAQALEVAVPGIKISAERLRCLLLWMTGASGAIVFIEPSPYELISFLTLVAFAIGGLSLSPALLPLGLLLVLINIGYSISASAAIDEQGVVAWLLTSWYLSLTAVFFAMMLGANTHARLDALVRGCIVAGVIAALVAIVGYFRIVPGADDLLLLYDRARGTFKDPNVLGAFLIFPTLLALQRVITGNIRQAAKGAMLLALLAAAILLSFSRAAWGQIVYTSAIVLALTFVTTRSPSLRLRVVLLTIAGIAVMTLFVVALLSIDRVAELFKERAQLEQSYDIGAQGRFARHILGAIFALDQPLGVGPLQFSKYFPEDPHNSYLNAFMAGGWLSGACYPALVALTLGFGLRTVFVTTPWQQTTITVYAAYFGVATESVIIDSDHWRHAFLLLGLLWGLMAATRSHVVRSRVDTAHNAPAFAGDSPALARQEATAYRFFRRSVAQPG
jgi:hypothetical protein